MSNCTSTAGVLGVVLHISGRLFSFPALGNQREGYFRRSFYPTLCTIYVYTMITSLLRIAHDSKKDRVSESHADNAVMKRGPQGAMEVSPTILFAILGLGSLEGANSRGANSGIKVNLLSQYKISQNTTLICVMFETGSRTKPS